MSGLAWLSFTLIALVAVAASTFVYRTRETAVRGRGTLAVLRATTLVLVILLLFDPELPSLAGGSAQSNAVLLDASLSMGLTEDGSTRWEAGVRRARSATGGDVLLFGERVRAVPADELASVGPVDTRSELLPALRAVAEAGVARVTVITDGAVDDATAVGRWSARLGLDVEFETVGEDVADHALVEIGAPGWAQADRPLAVTYGVASSGAAGTPLTVSVTRDGQVLATDTILSPGPGRIAPGTLTVDAAGPEGLVRYDVAIAGGDAASDDNVRSVYVYLSEDPAGVAVVSFEPDWEPRFLQPILARAIGVPVGGYLHAGPDDWVRLGGGADAGERIEDDVVQRAVERADLLVLHGVDARAPSWLQDAIAERRPILAFPGSGTPWVPVPVELARPVVDEWYTAIDVPASPIAGSLVGLAFDETPPLTALHLPNVPEGSWAPLVARRARRGEGQPIVIAGETDGQRWAVVLGNGFWRWAFRTGAPRTAYDRFWSALAGWLISGRGPSTGIAVQPVNRVVQRGAAVPWTAAGIDSDSLRVRISDEAGTAVVDTVVAIVRDTARTGILPPGHYVYAVGPNGGEESETGVFTVESYSPEFAAAAQPLEAMQAAAVPLGRAGRAGPARPLHATAWPYALIILLVATEWVLRRRWGLR